MHIFAEIKALITFLTAKLNELETAVSAPSADIAVAPSVEAGNVVSEPAPATPFAE